MVTDPFECPKCGSRMLNDFTKHGYMCPSCGNHEPFGHALGDGSRGAGAAGTGPPAPGADPGADGRAGSSPEGTGQGALDSGFQQQTLRSLASIMCIVYRGTEIRDLFRRSTVPLIWDHIGTDWNFLSGALERTQREFGPYGVTKILETVCAHQKKLGNRGVREDINECLSPFGVRIGDDCRVRRLGEAGAPATGEAELFDQRRFHPAVIEHAKPRFLKGDPFGSVVEGCKVLEELVREKSGIEAYGTDLLKRAFGDRGILEVDMADLTGKTRDGIRRGLGSMCEGMVSSVRNPASREYEQRFPISGTDALDILGVISYLCRQIEKMRRKPQPAPPKGGGPQASGSKGQGPREEPEELRSILRAMNSGGVQEVSELAVKPETVGAGEKVEVTVTGKDVGEWYVGIHSVDGTPMLAPLPLEVRGSPTHLEGGEERYALTFSTVDCRPGEYIVSVSLDKNMDAAGLQIKKFMVVDRMAKKAAGGKTAGTM